jgi:hypothetical protein
MFDWFRNLFSRPDYPTWKDIPDFNKVANDMKKVVPEVTPIPPIPQIPKAQMHDHYRVGYDAETGSTTLTLHSDYTSMTLSLGPAEVMRLIRMLGASLDDEDIASGLGNDEYDDE